MYNIIIENIINLMVDYALVEKIVVSFDIYDELTEDQIYEIESYLPTDQDHKWLIFKREQGLLSYIYRCPPREKKRR